MLYIYGSLMPLRVLEEIRFWKMQEREHTVVIRELVPKLEPEYAALLQQWEGVLAQTEAASQQWIEAVLRAKPPVSPYIVDKVNELLYASIAQSQEFIRQLFFILERSLPVRANPVVQTVFLHIIRESEYFLGVLHAVQGTPEGVEEFRAEDAVDAPDAVTENRAPDEEQAHIHLWRSENEPLPIDLNQLTATQEGTWAGERPQSAYSKPVPIGGHKLPPLPYAYNALEPYIDAETMRLHHDKHHKSYVDGLNKAENMLARARETGDFSLVKHWEREAAFHGAGHYLHTIFWNVMKPGGGGKATGPIAAEIKKSFGSYEGFRKQFSAAADKVEGGGWAILVWSPRSHRLEILQAEKHQNLSQWDVIPLLVLDVWEHAYYLKYKNERPKYIEAWWNTVNWDHVNERFAAARHLMWLPY
ncbi:superoxide dismutase, Fe-Mn family [Paenibacillus tianmuensis]|uniref:superoxide dismutase n=1 Tax=Paenibacillus tianmuensis TaxID=624147 RepID=A0A1G4RXJ6_9BACL|nr:Fe-Mn family superoxide dismutase [Paenibacillus tianmuensis]SCW61476.1 superoxide dismutase, Fe-Mn family [Paenibacillus tianmuensis]